MAINRKLQRWTVELLDLDTGELLECFDDVHGVDQSTAIVVAHQRAGNRRRWRTEGRSVGYRVPVAPVPA